MPFYSLGVAQRCYTNMAGKFWAKSRHGTVYYFRRRVPAATQHAIGRRVLVQSLETSDLDRPDELFVLITVSRTLAASRNWKVIPHHPLAATNIELMDYAEGFAAIDWEAMNRRDYHDPHSKSVCMAECLSPTTILPNEFFNIFVYCDMSAAYVDAQKKRHGVKVDVKINE